MYGMPFHSITAHFGEWYRLVALRSIAAENQERFFKSIKSSTTSTNYRDDHLTTNALLRIQSKQEDSLLAKDWLLQESVIAKEARRLPPRGQTIITEAMAAENPALLAAHKRRVADFLLDGSWHQEENGNLIFKDGEEDVPPINTNVQLMHIR